MKKNLLVISFVLTLLLGCGKEQPPVPKSPESIAKINLISAGVKYNIPMFSSMRDCEEIDPEKDSVKCHITSSKDLPAIEGMQTMRTISIYTFMCSTRNDQSCVMVNK